MLEARFSKGVNAKCQIDERITPFQSLMWEKLSVPTDDPSITSETATGETIQILQRPDQAEIHEKLDFLLSKGIKSIAVAFLHSYLWGEHEEMVAKIAKEKGMQVSVSSELQPMVRVIK